MEKLAVIGEIFPPEDIDRLWVCRKLLLCFGILKVGEGGDTDREEKPSERCAKSASSINIDILLGGTWKLEDVVLNRLP